MIRLDNLKFRDADRGFMSSKFAFALFNTELRFVFEHEANREADLFVSHTHTRTRGRTLT